MKKRFLGILVAGLMANIANAETAAPAATATPVSPTPVSIKENAPERYTVVAGDTLWGIAGRFLNDPWRWPQIWESNKQVYNPHLIYPGDVLLLCRIGERTVLAVDQGGGCAEVTARLATDNPAPPAAPAVIRTEMPDGTVKLRPRIREQALALAIPAIPLSEIQRYLNNSRVVTKEDLDKAPYVIEGEQGRVIVGAGDRAYVRDQGKQLINEASYGIYRGGQRYMDPETNEVLGYEAEDIGSGKIEALSDSVGTLEITRTTRNVNIGDRLLSNETSRVAGIFQPSNPDGVKPGAIIRVFDSIGSGAQYSVIVLNRGEADKVKPGDTFAIYRKGPVVRDRVKQEAIRLPSERSGLAMVFRTFSRVSYALVLRSSVPVKVGDQIRPPISGD